MTLPSRKSGGGTLEVRCFAAWVRVFESGLGASAPTQLIEVELERAFGEKVTTLVKTSTEMIEIARSIPRERGSNDGEQTYVAYLFSYVAKPSLVSESPVKRQFMSIFYADGANVWVAGA